jgi:hypothetical protein
MFGEFFPIVVVSNLFIIFFVDDGFSMAEVCFCRLWLVVALPLGSVGLLHIQGCGCLQCLVQPDVVVLFRNAT